MKKFELTLEELRDSGLIFYEVIAGSVAYGLNTPESDEDVRGYYHVPQRYRDGLFKVEDQVNDKKHDITYYNLKRAFQLLMTANPNQIELLWIPEDCIKIYNKAIMDEMFANRELFISKASYNSHFRYAKAQIGKAKGQNKWVNNPKPEKAPTKLDFCWVVPLFSEAMESVANCSIPWNDVRNYKGRFPARPEPLGHLPLSEYDVAKMEHMEHTYRLYKNGRGVFRGENEQLVCTSISKEREFLDFECLLIFNEPAFKRAYEDWKSYWKWMENRNEPRWVDQEKGNLDYDAKNMSHCLRLMLSSKNILTQGYPIVRFDGETRELLMMIKRGELAYEEIMEMVDGLQQELEVIVEKTHIPDEVDHDKLNKLYIHLNDIAERQKL
jgi:hypothetical protein